VTSDQLFTAMAKRGLGGRKSQDKLAEFCRLWVNERITTPKELKALAGSSYTTTCKWVKAARIIEKEGVESVPDAAMMRSSSGAA